MAGNHETGSAAWNDAMYAKHPTPYGKSLAGFIQSKRVRRVLAYAEIEAKDRVLEIGSEGGNLCAAVPPCARLVGCDISAKALDDAKKLLAQAGRKAEFLLVDALQPLPFQRGEFDVIICSEMLEHVPDPGAVIANISSICTINTRVVLSVPVEAPKLILKHWLEKLGVFRFLFPGIERGQSEWHLHAFSTRFLRRITESSFICDCVSTVWGCHVVARFRKIDC